jgi:uncharacterized protein (TIGR02186 family)
MAFRLLPLLVLLALPLEAAAQRIVADLSSREIAITTGFTGAELLLFGATEGAGDIVVTVEGPRRTEVVRRKERIAGIWVNGASVTFDKAPAYYWVASTRAIADIAPARLLAQHQIGAERLSIVSRSAYAPDVIAAFREAFIRNKRAAGLFGSGESEIATISNRLFRTTIRFPANVPTGEYLVTVYLFKNGRLVSRDRTPLAVHRTGMEAQIFNFARDQAPWYGAIAIAIALVAGWLAGVIFRRS